MFYYNSVDYVWLVVLLHSPGQTLGIQFQPLGHPQAPLVLDLPAEVEVHHGDEEAVPGPAQSRGPAPVRGRHVAGAVEVTEVLVSWQTVTRRELPGERLRPDPVDGAREVAVGDGSVPGLHRPHGLRQSADRGARVEDYLGPVDSVHHPVLGVVAAVADVDGDLAVDGGEDSVASVTLHVVSRLVEVPHPRDVVLPRLPQVAP